MNTVPVVTNREVIKEYAQPSYRGPFSRYSHLEAPTLGSRHNDDLIEKKIGRIPEGPVSQKIAYAEAKQKQYEALARAAKVADRTLKTVGTLAIPSGLAAGWCFDSIPLICGGVIGGAAALCFSCFAEDLKEHFGNQASNYAVIKGLFKDYSEWKLKH